MVMDKCKKNGATLSLRFAPLDKCDKRITRRKFVLTVETNHCFYSKHFLFK